MTFDGTHLAERSRENDSGGTALRAASLSFSSSSGPTLPPRAKSIQTNDAFLAATKAGYEHSYREPVKQSLSRTYTEIGPPLPPRSQALALRDQTSQRDHTSQSPSGIAALLAAERFSPVSRSSAMNGLDQQMSSTAQKRQTWAVNEAVGSKRWQYDPPDAEAEPKVDSTPIQRLDKLINAFEGGSRKQSLRVDAAPTVSGANSQPEIHSPIPVRPVKSPNIPLTAALQAARNEHKPSVSSLKDAFEPAEKSFSLIAAHSVSPDKGAVLSKFPPQPQLPPRTSSYNSSIAVNAPASKISSNNTSDDSVVLVTESENSSLEKLPRRIALSPPSTRISPAPFEANDTGIVIPAPLSPSPTRPVERIQPTFTGSSMRDAIAASSLASSRAPSPSIVLPIPGQDQQHGRGFRKMLSPPRHTPSPSKGMRTTMRAPIPQQKTGDESDQPQARRGLHKKHPNKHKEGDRKRWQVALTDAEIKRYEGLWAANRGHLIQSGTRAGQEGYLRGETARIAKPEEMVLDLVTRDIWMRSRLSPDTLAEIWDLVNLSAMGLLLKTEFIVGTWLIDQCLKGRKPPARISESIWLSVEKGEELRTRAQGLL